MNIKCPHCGTEYEVDKEWYGQYTTCDSCGKGFVVGTSRQNIEMITPLPDRMSTDVERKQGWSVPDTKTCLRQSKLPSQHGRYSTACFKWGWPCLVLIIFDSSCMTVGGFSLHKFAWPLFYGLLSRSSGPRNFD